MDSKYREQLIQKAIKFFRDKDFAPHDHEVQEAENYAEFAEQLLSERDERIREFIQNFDSGKCSVKELLSDAYASGWRKSKQHQKRSNFLGLNRKEINEIFKVWYYSKMRDKIHEPQTDKEHNVDRQYTIDEVMRCVEHWGLCKVEKEYIEKFLNEPQTDKEL